VKKFVIIILIVSFIILAYKVVYGSPLDSYLIAHYRMNDNADSDNVMIFNKALTPDEVKWLYNSGNGREDIATRYLIAKTSP